MYGLPEDFLSKGQRTVEQSRIRLRSGCELTDHRAPYSMLFKKHFGVTGQSLRALSKDPWDEIIL